MNLDELKSRIPIIDLAQHLDIQCDSHHKALCPFHEEKIPSLVFYPETDTFFCFGCCRSGSIFDLVMFKKDCSFAEAVKYLCRYAGIPVPSDSDSSIVKSHASQGLETAYKIFNEAGIRNRDKLAAWGKDRNISPQILEQCGAVYISGGELTRHGGFDVAQWAGLYAAGLIYQMPLGTANNDHPYLHLGYRPQDIFYYAGVLFPIYDEKGKLVGFVCRSADPSDKIPKYKYNNFFPKRSSLFGIDTVMSRVEAVRKNKKKCTTFDLFLVEGIIDSVRMNALGLNALAIMGTSLAVGAGKQKNANKTQFDLLEMLAQKLPDTLVHLHVFLDNDVAGQTGAKRNFNTLQELCNRCGNLNFDFVCGRLGDKKDPDEILAEKTRTEIDHFLATSLYSPAEFLIASEMDISPVELNSEWNSCTFFRKNLAMMRVVEQFAPDSAINFEALLNYGYGEHFQKSSSEAANRFLEQLKYKFTRKASRVPLQDKVSIPWGEIVEKARVSYADSDFPVDFASWERIRSGLPVLQYFLQEQLANPGLIEPCITAYHPRGADKLPRMLALPSPEDLILETAFLTDLLILGTQRPGSIPLVFDAGKGPVTYRKLSNGEQSFSVKTVSFAYQFNACDEGTDGIYASRGIFKDFIKCWNDYNNYLLREVNLLEKTLDEVCCIRLDIHRYYDSISYANIFRLLEKIFEGNLLSQRLPPALTQIIKAGNDNSLANLTKWVCNRCFHYPFYDTGSGNINNTDSSIGIPQGPNLSAWLANVLLFDLDAAAIRQCDELNQKYRQSHPNSPNASVACFARYVDDMIIVAPTRSDAESIQAVILKELQRLGLYLSDKIENEEIRSFAEMRQMLRRNRGVLAEPYGSGVTELTAYNESTFAFGLMIGNIDRKNMLSYIHSLECMETVLTTDRATFTNRLVEIIRSTEEIRYRDYRKVLSLILHATLAEQQVLSLSSSGLLNVLMEFLQSIYHPLCYTPVDENESVTSVNQLWPLFSILEAMQNVLYSKMEQLPLLSTDARTRLELNRQALARLILEQSMLDKLELFVFGDQKNSKHPFRDSLACWKIALTVTATRILNVKVPYILSNENGYWRYRYGLTLAPEEMLSSDSADRFPERLIVYQFHRMIYGLMNDRPVLINHFHGKFLNFNCFKALCADTESPKPDLKPLAAEEFLDALSVLARCVSAGEHFNKLHERPYLTMTAFRFCNQNADGVRLLASPMAYCRKHLLAFCGQKESLCSAEMIVLKDSDRPETFELLDFKPSEFLAECNLSLYSADIASRRLGAPLSQTAGYAQKLDCLQQIWNFYSKTEQNRDTWEHLVFSCQNIVRTTDQGYSLIALYNPDVFPYALLKNGELRSFDVAQSRLFKIGCAALEYAGLTVPSQKNKTARIADPNIDFSTQNWCAEFLTHQAQRLFSGILGKKNFQNPEARIRFFFEFWEKLQHGELSEADKITRYWDYQWEFALWRGQKILDEASVRNETAGSLFWVLERMLTNFFKYEPLFCDCLKRILLIPPVPSSVRSSIVRKNALAWYSLAELLEALISKSQASEKNTIPLPALFRGYAALVYARSLCYDWKELLDEAFFLRWEEFSEEVYELAELYQLNECSWFEGDKGKDEERTARVKKLFSTFKGSNRNSDTQEKMEPVGIALLLYLMWKYQFRPKPKDEPGKIIGDLKQAEELLFTTFAQTLPEKSQWESAKCIGLSKIYDRLIVLLEEFEAQSDIETLPGQGSNPCNGTRSFFSISRQMNYVYRDSQMEVAQIRPSLDMEHVENGQQITYYWSETWRGEKLLSVACITQSLGYYIELLKLSPQHESISTVMVETKDEMGERIVPKSETSTLPENKEEAKSDRPPDASVSTQEREKAEMPPEIMTENLRLLFDEQKLLWAEDRGRRNPDRIRIALCQFDIRQSAYCYEADSSMRYDAREFMFDPKKHDGNKAHIIRILDRAIQMCKAFNVDALVLPEYSVTPQLIDALRIMLAANAPTLIVWAGTFRNSADGSEYANLDDKYFEKVKTQYNMALLCAVRQDGILAYRGKKYPALGVQEDFKPNTETISPLFKNYDKVPVPAFTKFISEYICSEIFMMTSPANAFAIAQAHRDLRNKYCGGKVIGNDKISYKEDVIDDYMELASNSGLAPDPDGVSTTFQERVRRTIFLIPACSSRAKDFHALGQNNSLVAGITSVFCNATSTSGHLAQGESCFIGYGSTDKDNAMHYLPYNGFMPGVLMNPNGQVLGRDEEALVIADINPYNGLDCKPRPQMQLPPLDLIAHIPFIKILTPSDKGKKSLRDEELYWYQQKYHRITEEIRQLLKERRKRRECTKENFDYYRKASAPLLDELNMLMRIDENHQHILCRRRECLEREKWRTRSPLIPAALYDFCFYEEPFGNK